MKCLTGNVILPWRDVRLRDQLELAALQSPIKGHEGNLSITTSSNSFGPSIYNLSYACSFSKLQSLFRCCGRKEMHHPSDNSCPSGLMARAEASSVVSVEVFVEQQEIAPMRVLLKFRGSPVDGSPAVLTAEKDA